MKKKEQTQINSFIYCGPTLKNGELVQYSIFKTKIPEHVLQKAIEIPAIKSLIVPIDDVVIVKERLKDKNSSETYFFNQILKGVKI